ncbi:hypothetical protein NQ117_03020 [Paenibacillus sp. SC116]|uniref:hypothetical protein n=1 Tax=Paenibacillus sp. SC116 TaxID=2968986 RepID=UPI00215A7D51|nr:hypothetical protein [Paenibacillus sp. SC116]MCR8842642.1 hypothetical protein [Paenibacillus sp. SC116]
MLKATNEEMNEVIRIFNQIDIENLEKPHNYFDNVGGRSDDGELYKVTTIDEIRPFIISIGREQCFYNFFWKDSRTVIIGSFDLSLPIYSDVRHIHTFKDCAVDSELFIRT